MKRSIFYDTITKARHDISKCEIYLSKLIIFFWYWNNIDRWAALYTPKINGILFVMIYFFAREHRVKYEGV